MTYSIFVFLRTIPKWKKSSRGQKGNPESEWPMCTIFAKEKTFAKEAMKWIKLEKKRQMLLERKR